MRVKKQKRNRRTVKFYTACFGFRQPYKVLCDGTFVHHLLVNQITPADTALSNILGGAVKLFTTRCVLAELNRLGIGFSESLEAAHKLGTSKCDHEKPKAADACILEVIGENNSEHFFVGSQDVELRKKLQQVRGVPLVFGLRNALLLEQPSEFQRQFAKSSEEERLHMTQVERKMLEKRTMKILGSDREELNNLSDENDQNESSHELEVRKQTIPRPRGLGVKDGVQFKRKKAKGPNPLSCKKKQQPGKPKSMLQKETKDEKSDGRHNRKRKRSRKNKGLLETTT